MSLAPRTLFGRNALLLLILFLLGLAAGMLTLREWIQKPRITELANLVARHVRLASASLQAVPGSRRDAVRAWLESQDAIQVVPATAGGPPGGRVLPAPAAQQFVSDLRRRLPDAAEIRWTPKGGGAVWVRMSIGPRQYWLVERGVFLVGDISAVGVGTLLVFAALSLSGAALIQRRTNRPLARLVEAAKTLAAGRAMTPLNESGPEELALVSRAFNHMTASLHRADAERAVLLAGVSHDVRTPIAKLRLAIEMLTGPDDAALVDSMRRSTAELEAVTDQFLYYARQDNPADFIETDLNSIVLESLDRYRGGRDEPPSARPVRIKVGPPCSLALHPESISRALGNLIQNAQRYGGGSAEVVTDFRDGIATVSVLDRGPGIPPEEVEMLKKPFARGSASVGTSGTGLGLAIVERIAKAHQARFELLPREGGGLEARLQFERAAATSDPGFRVARDS